MYIIIEFFTGFNERLFYNVFPGQGEYERHNWQNVDMEGHPQKKYAESEAFKCSACGKNYSCKKTLKRHVSFECGGQKRFICNHCPAKYSQNVALRRHLLKSHNIYVPPRKRLAQ